MKKENVSIFDEIKLGLKQAIVFESNIKGEIQAIKDNEDKEQNWQKKREK